jgi:hypothetical protein
MNRNAAQCTFTTEYFDYQSGKSKEFRCDQLPLGNKDLCLFHDEAYLKGSDHQGDEGSVVSRRLHRRVENSVIDKRPLVCIGYYLPGTKIDGKFKQPVYFNSCKFSGVTDFTKAVFSSDVSFTDALFSSEAIFYRATFSCVADFNYALFSSEVVFCWATFSGVADFTKAKFLDRTDFYCATFLVEPLFSNTTFSGVVDF